MFRSALTEIQKDVNKCLTKIKGSDLQEWISRMPTKISGIHDSFKGPNKTNSCMSAFLNNFGRSEEFQELLRNLVRSEALSKAHKYIGVQLLILVQNGFLESLSTSSHHPTPHSPDSSAIVSGGTKVRYVAGMCVCRVPHKETQYICRNIFSTSPDLQQGKTS